MTLTNTLAYYDTSEKVVEDLLKLKIEKRNILNPFVKNERDSERLGKNGVRQ